MRTVVLDLADWPEHRAGQHVDIRLTAEDGYRAERAYSIASAPGEPRRDHRRAARGRRGVAVPDGGAARRRRARAARPDRRLLRLGAGGRRAAAPRRRRLRRRSLPSDAEASTPARKRRSDATALLVAHARGRDLPRRARPARGRARGRADADASQPAGWAGYARRVDQEMLREVAWPADESPLAFVCGPTSFVETVADALVALGYAPARVKTERFGATGGR